MESTTLGLNLEPHKQYLMADQATGQEPVRNWMPLCQSAISDATGGQGDEFLHPLSPETKPTGSKSLDRWSGDSVAGLQPTAAYLGGMQLSGSSKSFDL